MIVFRNELCHVLACASSKHDEIYQRVCAQAVGTMHRDTGNLTGGVEAGQGCPLWVNDDTGIDIGWNASHGIVGCGLDGNWFSNWLDAKIVTRKVGDIRQLLVYYLCSQVS